VIAWVEVTVQAAWQRLAGFSLVRAMLWKARVDRRRARPVADGVVTVERRRAVR